MSAPVRILACATGAFLFCAVNASAVILDWDTAAWTNGSLTNSYDVDPATPGNDITVTVSGNTTQLTTSTATGTPITPAITVGLEGGLSPVQKSLELAVDLTSQAQFITVTVNFSALYAAGVQNVSFSIFDVDFSKNQFQDQLRQISGLSVDGITQVAPTITTSSANLLSGTGLTQVVNGIATSTDTGATSNAGNVLINFGTNAITSFTFTYGSGSNTIADPTYQHIGIHDISFTPIPEINPAWSAVGSCLAAAGLVIFHRGRIRKH